MEYEGELKGADNVARDLIRASVANVFAERFDNADEMLAQSRSQPLVMGIALHPYLVGQPYRLRHLRRALQHLVAARDRGEIWFTTPGAICQHMEGLARHHPEEHA